MTLSTALMLLGGVLLMALIAHSAWTLHKARPRSAGLAQADLGNARNDPVLEHPTSQPGETLRPTRRSPRLDALIDALVPLALETPISGDLVLAHLSDTRRAGSKPMLIEGLDTETGDWNQPAPGRRYGELQAGVQLANRSGALNQIEYSEFVQKVQLFADNVGADPDFPDMLEVVARARELDTLAGPLDVQLTVTLRSNSVAWSVGYIQQIAARHGFVAGLLTGRMVQASGEEGAPPVLVLSFDAQAALDDEPQTTPVRECILTLDVPQIEQRTEPFPAWHAAARALSDDMDALLVDDHGQPITLHAFAAIGQELQTLYGQLETFGLAAGSPAARRLFS